MKLPAAALLLPLALLLAACSGTSSADCTIGGSGGGTDGKGTLTLNVGDQKGGSEAVLRAAGELDDLDYKIRWSTFTSGPPLLEAINATLRDAALQLTHDPHFFGLGLAAQGPRAAPPTAPPIPGEWPPIRGSGSSGAGGGGRSPP